VILDAQNLLGSHCKLCVVKVFVFWVFLLQVEAESEVSEFLSVLKFGTHNVYGRGLAVFQQFYSSQGSIKDFLDCVERDRLLPKNQRKRVDRMTLNNFLAWLQYKEYMAGTDIQRVEDINSMFVDKNVNEIGNFLITTNSSGDCSGFPVKTLRVKGAPLKLFLLHRCFCLDRI